MRDILFEYELSPTTWAYLSALLTIGTYFKFRRFWSVRNLDLLGLIGFSPGLLLIFHGLLRLRGGSVLAAETAQDLVSVGYGWLFVVGALLTVRLFLDPLMVRRPLLEPNLNGSGLVFTAAALCVFLTANVLSTNPPERLEHALARQDPPALESPGFAYFHYLSSFATAAVPARESRAPIPESAALWSYPSRGAQLAVWRILAIAGQLTLIAGIVWIGYRHFDNIFTGVAAASLYLLLPYTAQMTGRIDHVVPAALLIWTLAMYRRPVLSGLMLGLVSGLTFYPLFLLPLWSSFYWRRGLFRFAGTVVFTLVALVALAAILAPDRGGFWMQLRQLFGATALSREGLAGFWQNHQPTYRIPMFAVFAVLAASLALWPAQKNLGTLLSCSATVLLGVQFWHGHEGGLYMAWYLPLVVLTIFRPNLEDRVALSAVIEGRTTWVARLLYGRRAANPARTPANSSG